MSAEKGDIPGGRIAVLDGLRALAIFLVVARHSLKLFWIDHGAPFLPIGPFDAAAFFLNGWTGVDLFFVLSGFLITRQLLLSNAAAGTGAARRSAVLDFFKKRFFRIAPAYYAVLTLAALGLFAPYPLESAQNMSLRYLYHISFMHDYATADIIPVFWSLAVEFKFYFLAPFIVIALMRLKSTRARCGMIGGAFALSIAAKFLTATLDTPGATDYEFFFTHLRTLFHLSLDGLLAGMLCALLWSDEKIRARIENPRAANALFYGGTALFLALTGFVNLVDVHVSLFDKTLLAPLLAVAFAAMMLGLLGGCRGHGLFAGRPLRGIALVSYSMYLLHMTFLIPSYNIMRGFMPAEAPAALQWLAFLIPYVLMCAVFSTLLYFVMEKPFIDWSKRKKQE